jgi:flagellar basal-body rod modification protein FlgD
MAVNPTTAREQVLDSVGQARDQTSTTQGLEDRFLKLLITQMRNQDPLNPLDNAQVTSQLAQISTVSGIDKLNGAVNGMADSFVAAQSLQAGSLIGHGVLAPGDGVLLNGGQAVGGLELAEPADQVVITVRGASGEALKILSLGPQESGTRAFRWDGSLDAGGQAGDGAYLFDVSAVRGGKSVKAQALGYGQVQSVTLGGGQLQLNTNGLGAVGLSQIRQIL